jgi:tetratricopeptide (TPR) repeat protein
MIDEAAHKYLQRAELLIEISRWREAVHQLHLYLSVYPNDYHTLCELARCYYELEELQTALDFTRKAIESDPETEWAYRLQSLIYRESHEYDKALQCAEVCVRKSPFQLYSLQTLAYSQIKKWRMEDAEKTISVMLQNHPDELMTHDVCGYLALKKEDWKNAEIHFKEALKIDANQVNSLNNLGVVYLNQSQKSTSRADRKKFANQSIECFERAIKASPTFKLAQDNLKSAKTGSKIDSRISVGMVIGLIFLLNSVGRVSLGLFAALVGLFNPFSSNKYLFTLNFIFIVNVVFWAFFGVYFYAYADREKITRLTDKPRFWLILFAAQIVPSVAFISIFTLTEADATPFSVLAIIGFSGGAFFTLLKLAVAWKNREFE